MELSRASIRGLTRLSYCAAIAALFLEVHLAQRTFAADPCALAAQLSWSSIGGNTAIDYMQVWPEGDAATKLWLMGKEAAPCLVSVLEDRNRGPAAHLILTNIYHRDRISPSLRFVRAGHGANRIVGVMQTINGLTWRYDPRTSQYTVKTSELKRNAARWRQELSIK